MILDQEVIHAAISDIVLSQPPLQAKLSTDDIHSIAMSMASYFEKGYKKGKEEAEQLRGEVSLMDEKTAKSIDKSLKSMASSLEKMSKNSSTVVFDPTIIFSGSHSEEELKGLIDWKQIYKKVKSATDYRQG